MASAIGWIVFYYYRKFLNGHITAFNFHEEFKFLLGLLIIPGFWFILYYSTGYYNNILRKTRLEDFGKTFIVTFIGILAVFFFLILDDFANLYKNYYSSFTTLFLLHFSLTFISRVSLTSYLINQEIKGNIKFKTLLIGRTEKLRQIWRELTSRYPGHGHYITGYIPIAETEDDLSDLNFKKLGEFYYVLKVSSAE